MEEYEEDYALQLRRRGYVLDVAVLRKAVEWAEAEAAKSDERQCEWFQSSWVVSAEKLDRECGTCYCIAGYIACEIAGRPSYGVAVEYIAAVALNVPYWVVKPLFHGNNSIGAVRRIAERLVIGYGEPGETL